MRVGQTKRGSLLESLVNIAVGAGVAFWSQVIVFHFMGIPVRYGQNLIITAIFTVISIVRSFILRRIFNWWTEHHQEKKPTESYGHLPIDDVVGPGDIVVPISIPPMGTVSYQNENS